jgi:predicted RNase H-like nuclease (RuvC/YqgF family)
MFSGLSWLFQSIIEHWKIWAVVATVGYVFLLNNRVHRVTEDNDKLSDIVFKQDSTIVAIRSKYMVDSVNLVEREVGMQKVIIQLSDETIQLNKDLEKKDKLIKELADGIKCKNIFGKIVDCKK